jgi:hypothetical protein
MTAPMGWTLAVSAVVSLVAAAVFLFVGELFRRRVRGSGGQLALGGFTVYWYGIGTYTLFGALGDALAALGVTPFALFLGIRYVTIPVASAALAGLGFYIVYLYTGRAGWAWPIGAFYGLITLGMWYYVTRQHPVGVAVLRWRTDLAYEHELVSPVFLGILLALMVPQLVAAVAYLTLVRRVDAPTQRWRILLVGSGIILWFSSSLAARAADDDLWQLVTRPGLGMLVAAMVLAAYRPPVWARKRFGLLALPDARQVTPRGRATREERSRLLAARARELL